MYKVISAPSLFLTFVIFGIFFSFSFTSVLSAVSVTEILEKQDDSLIVGIISAVPGESGRLLDLMEAPTVVEKGMRTYYKGTLYGINTVLVASRIGKVAAAATAANLILEYNVDFIIFTGVAGAIDPVLNIGDVVVADALMQHDVDARPFCPLYEIPLLKISACLPDPLLEKIAVQAVEQFVKKDIFEIIPRPVLNEFKIVAPKVYRGLVITGDQVISQESQKRQLRQNIPGALCVEMEGASVGQVCYEYGIPFAVIRMISDYANHEHLPVDVIKFIHQVSGYYSIALIKNMYAQFNKFRNRSDTSPYSELTRTKRKS